MVQASLAILRRVDSVPLAKLNLAQILQAVHLPLNEAVVVGVGLGCDHGAAPVNTASKVGEITLPERREVLQPVV